MEISPGWASAGATIAAAVGGVIVRWVHGSLKDQRDDHNVDIKAVKDNQHTLFEKHDAHIREFQEHRLHVAETYVNRDVLKEQLAPIHQTLEEIKDELREERKK